MMAPRLMEMQVSPEFILRPSLSESAARPDRVCIPERVAGVYTPAFVERVRVHDALLFVPATCRRSLYSGLR